MSNGHTRLGRHTFLEAKCKFNESSGPDDDKAAFAILKKSASLGYTEAHEWLGYVYDYG
jgi:TPR repeat protein